MYARASVHVSRRRVGSVKHPRPRLDVYYLRARKIRQKHIVVRS